MNKRRYTIPLIEEYETIFNVRSFGAKGDGVTDDTAAIQGAIDAAYAAGGGIVFFPLGTYIVNSPIKLSLSTDGGFPVWLKGSGHLATRLKTNADINILEITNTVLNIRNWRVSDIMFDGGKSSIYLKNAAYGIIERCLFYAGSGASPQARIYADIAQSVIINGNMAYHTVGTDVMYLKDTNGLLIIGNLFGEDIAIGLNCLRPYMLITASNRFTDFTSKGIYMVAPRLCSIVGNVMRSTSPNVVGIYLANTDSYYINTRCTITGNIVELTGSGGFEAALILRGTDQNFVIGNIFKATRSFYQFTDVISPDNNVVIGNRLDGQLAGEIDKAYFWNNTGTNPTNVVNVKLHLSVISAWDPPSVPTGEFTSVDVTVSQASVGDTAVASFDQPLPAGVTLHVAIVAANTVRVTLLNLSGTTVDLAAGNLRIDVWKH